MTPISATRIEPARQDATDDGEGEDTRYAQNHRGDGIAVGDWAEFVHVRSIGGLADTRQRIVLQFLEETLAPERRLESDTTLGRVDTSDPCGITTGGKLAP